MWQLISVGSSYHNTRSKRADNCEDKDSLISGTLDEIVFDIVTREQNTLDLWTFSYTTGNLTNLAFLNHTTIKEKSSLGGPYMGDPYIDLLLEGSRRRVFWDQKVNFIYEIFSTTHDPVTNEWTPVIQLTDTNVISAPFCSNIDLNDYIETILLLMICGIVVLSLLFFKKRTTNEIKK
ncbi:MAG: hypothetical protein ACFFC7_06260 [Candidatus Hermodarchaeota archaeon]